MERRNEWNENQTWEPDPRQPATNKHPHPLWCTNNQPKRSARPHRKVRMRFGGMILEPGRIGCTPAAIPACEVIGSRSTASGDVGRGETTMESEPSVEIEHGETLQEPLPRIYVASLSDYNNGILHGEWIDAGQDDEVVHHQITTLLRNSPSEAHAEEYAVHDFEGFGQYRVGEYEPIETINAVARGIAEHGPAYAAWASHCDGELERLDQFDDAYRGEWNSLTEYAEQLLDDLGLEHIIEQHIPESLQAYVTIDSEAFANDLTLSADITAVEHADGVWVFEGNL